MHSIVRGSVWWLDIPIYENSHVQGGGRPYVVVSNVQDNRTVSVVSVCPMSTKIDGFAAHAKVRFRKDAQVLCDQITTIDISDLQEYLGQLSESSMKAVDDTLLYQLCLSAQDDWRTQVDTRLTAVERAIERLQ